MSAGTVGTGGPVPAGAPGTADAVVVGGGLAGLTAAVRLADAGARVTLLESRPRLGGATHSFHRDGLVVDNGQHVFLRCYTAYLGFLRRLGTRDLTAVQPRFTVPVLTPGGRTGTLYRTGLPAPLHLGSSLARYPLLRPADRARVVRAALRLRTLDPDDPSLERRGFGAWLDTQGQTAACVRALWEPFTVAALNLPVAEASLGLAVKVFRTGLLSARDAADIGVPLVPLEHLHGAAAERVLRRSGARVLTSARVRAVGPVPGGLAVDTSEERLTATAVVLAVPHHAASAVLPDGAVAQPFDRLGSEPIVNLHVVFDRPVTDRPFAAAVDSPVQWFFDRSTVSGLPRAEGQYLAVSLSAARDHLRVPTARLRERFLPELERLLPRARDARVRSFFVTREPRATFRQEPGTRRLRPPAATGVPGLLLAGAWTDTGWPDVMEGAVRSGEEAARLALAHLAAHRAGQEVTA